jgi:hypothetical protein
MTIISNSALLTDPAYALKEAKRTNKAYDTSRDFQDIVHEMTICARNGLSGDACGTCLGCTFRTFLTNSPKYAMRVLTYAMQELNPDTDESGQFAERYETDLSGFGDQFAQFVTLQVECTAGGQLRDMVYKASFAYAGRNGGMWPNVAITAKTRNSYIWDLFAYLVTDFIN